MTVQNDASVIREVMHLKELIEARLNEMDKALVEARDTARAAITEARESAQRAVTELDATSRRALGELDIGIRSRLEAASTLTDTKFVTYRTLLDANEATVALALSSADKAVSKAEASTEKRFDAVNAAHTQISEATKSFVTRAEYTTTIHSLTEKIDDLKAYRDAATGKSQGANVESRLDEMYRQLATGTSTLAEVGGRSAGRAQSFAWVIAAVGLLATVLTIVVVLAGVGR